MLICKDRQNDLATSLLMRVAMRVTSAECNVRVRASCIGYIYAACIGYIS